MQSMINNNLLLPSYFTPGAQHVVIGKGKKYCQHAGNLYLRDIVQHKLSLYLNATSKVSKSSIISSVIDQIHHEGGFFLQLDKDTGRWIKATDYLTREKTSQAFRDALRHQYKSSRQNKRRIKVEDNEAFISNPLLIDATTSAPQQSCKRQRTENTITLSAAATVVTPNTSLSSLDFPVLPLSEPCSYQLYNTMHSTQNMESDKEEIDTDLFRSICSSFLTEAEDNVFDYHNTPFDEDNVFDYHNTPFDEDNDLFEPIPLDEIVMTPLPFSSSGTPFPMCQQTIDEENAFYYESNPLLQQTMVDNNNNNKNNNESGETMLLHSVLTRIVSDC